MKAHHSPHQSGRGVMKTVLRPTLLLASCAVLEFQPNGSLFMSKQWSRKAVTVECGRGLVETLFECIPNIPLREPRSVKNVRSVTVRVVSRTMEKLSNRIEGNLLIQVPHSDTTGFPKTDPPSERKSRKREESLERFRNYYG